MVLRQSINLTINHTGTFGLNLLRIKASNWCRTRNSIFCQLVDAFVKSIHSFPSEVWGFGKCKKRINHLELCKTFLSLVFNFNMGGRYPLNILGYTRIIKF